MGVALRPERAARLVAQFREHLETLGGLREGGRERGCEVLGGERGELGFGGLAAAEFSLGLRG